MRYYFLEKQVELALFFTVYSKHPISQKYSFTFVLEKFLYAFVRLYSCPNLHDKLSNLFSSDEFKRKIEAIKDHKQMLHELFFNHLFNDESLMFASFDFLLEPVQSSFEMEFRVSFMYVRNQTSYFEFQDIVLCIAMLDYQFEMKKIMKFVTSLRVSRNDFFQTLFCKRALKPINHVDHFVMDDYLLECNSFIWYVARMFEGDDLQIARNLIRHFIRAQHCHRDMLPFQAGEGENLAKKMIEKIVEVYNVDLNDIEEEFSEQHDVSTETYEQNEQFWEKMKLLIEF